MFLKFPPIQFIRSKLLLFIYLFTLNDQSNKTAEINKTILIIMDYAFQHCDKMFKKTKQNYASQTPLWEPWLQCFYHPVYMAFQANMWSFISSTVSASVGLDLHSDSESKVTPPMARTDAQQMNGVVDDQTSVSSDILVCYKHRHLLFGYVYLAISLVCPLSSAHLLVYYCLVMLVFSYGSQSRWPFVSLLSCFSPSPLALTLKCIKGVTAARISPFYIEKLLLSCTFVILYAEKLFERSMPQ